MVDFMTDEALETLLRNWDGEEVITRFDTATGAWIIIAIHSTRLGPAGGGTRMKVYPGLAAAMADAMQLAQSMSYKFAIIGFPQGGSKSVIALPGVLEPAARAALLHRYGALVHQLGGLVVTGPDVGTGPAEMDIVAETGSPYVFGRSVGSGGSGDSGTPTALGVFQGIQVACTHLFGNPSPAGKRVLIQGLGSVGAPLARYLTVAGAEVLGSDVAEDAVRRLQAELQLAVVPTETVLDTPCDIFAPCALGGVVNQHTIPRLRCRIVAGSANNQLRDPADASLLHERGILYAPDFIINVGGAVSLVGVEAMGWSPEEVERRIVEGITSALHLVFERSAAEGIPTTVAAKMLADERLAREETQS